jgi:3-oxoacyl-[acyl-carrier protein] reductase
VNRGLDALQLRGQVALVTGGSRGIGRAVCELLGELGANVVVNYVHDAVAADSVVETVRAKGPEAISCMADVADIDEAQGLVKVAVEQFGKLDIVICSAGIWEGASVDEMSEDLWDRSLNINLKGTWSVCRAAIPEMKRQRSGKIVIVSSTAGQRGEAGYSNYAASKGGQISLVKSLAEELGEWRIRVNAVAPGWVDTEMTADALGDDTRRASINRKIPTRQHRHAGRNRRPNCVSLY